MTCLFDKLFIYAWEIEGFWDDNYFEPRWIYGDQTESKWLTETKFLDSLSYLPGKKAGIASFEDKDFYIIASKRTLADYPYFLQPYKSNAGLLTAILYELEIPINSGIQHGYIDNNLSVEFKGMPGYKGHSLEIIMKAFESFEVFSIGNDCRIEENKAGRITGSIIAKNPEYLTLQFDKETLDEFDNTFLYGPKAIPYDNLLSSLLSTTFKHSFIELYQCLESLYQVVYIDKLYKSIKPNTTFLDFLQEVEKNLSWRPIGLNALDRILSDTPTHLYQELQGLKKKITGSGDKLAQWIYNHRNRLVHLKPIQNKSSLEVKEWNAVVRDILRISKYWFHEFDDLLA